MILQHADIIVGLFPDSESCLSLCIADHKYSTKHVIHVLNIVKPLGQLTKEANIKIRWIHVKENLSFHRLQLKLKYSTQLQSLELSIPAAVPDEKGVPLYAVPDKLKKVVACNNLFQCSILLLSGLPLDFFFRGGYMVVKDPLPFYSCVVNHL